MSKSADIVARSLLNTHHASVKLGVLKFRVYQPFVKDLARAFAGGKIDVSISGRQKYSMETISKLLFRRSWCQKLFLWYAKRYATCEEISAATMKIADIVSGKDLFDSVKIDKTRRKTVSETVGNNTITGNDDGSIEHLLQRSLPRHKLPYHATHDDRQGAHARRGRGKNSAGIGRRYGPEKKQ